MAAAPERTDLDHIETEEWLESLAAVIERDGVERAHFLVQQLIDAARQAGATLPYSANTPYINTIPESRETWGARAKGVSGTYDWRVGDDVPTPPNTLSHIV